MGEALITRRGGGGEDLSNFNYFTTYAGTFNTKQSLHTNPAKFANGFGGLSSLPSINTAAVCIHVNDASNSSKPIILSAIVTLKNVVVGENYAIETSTGKSVIIQFQLSNGLVAPLVGASEYMSVFLHYSVFLRA